MLFLPYKVTHLRYAIEFSYNGSAYFGYQIQPREVSVQGTLEDALSMLLGAQVKTVGAGRTDTGVHARKMVAHFDFEPSLRQDLVTRLNRYLPADIWIERIVPVSEDFHARFDATYRRYQYLISLKKDPFLQGLSWSIYPRSLDVEAMQKGAEIVLQYSDFACFSKVGADNKTTICRIDHAFWEEKEGLLVFSICADRFLRNMVRAIVGTLVDVGLGKRKAQDLHGIIQSKSRAKASGSAPAHGLYLVDVGYPTPL